MSVAWTAQLFMCERIGKRGGRTTVTRDGSYRGVEVVSAQWGKVVRYGIFVCRKPIITFLDESGLCHFIDKFLESQRESIASMREVIRLRAMCAAYGIDPDWPLPDEYEKQLLAFVETGKAGT